MQPTGKRTVQVNVKMTTEDFDLLKGAAEKLWPDAILSNSAIILGLAKMTARATVHTGPKREQKAPRRERRP
jgi:hypothetical protein